MSKKKVVYRTEHPAGEDGRGILAVTLDFNNARGTYKATATATTECFSLDNPDLNAGVLKTMVAMVTDAYELGNQLRLDWGEANPDDGDDPDQLRLFAGDESHEMREVTLPPVRGRKKAAAAPTGTDGEGFGDALKMSGNE